MKPINLIIYLLTFAPLGLLSQVHFAHSAESRKLYLIEKSDTIKTLKNVDTLGSLYKGSLPFVSGSMVGLLDSNLSTILSPKYQTCDSELEFKDGLLKVSKGLEGVAYLDQNGLEKITLENFCSCCFDKHWATGFKNGFAISYNGEWAIIDTSGTTTEIFSEDEFFLKMDLETHFHKQNSQGTVLFKTAGSKYGIIMNGYVAIAPIYSEIIISQSASEGLELMCKDEKISKAQSYRLDSSRDQITKFGEE